MASTATDEDGVYLASVSSLRRLTANLWVARVQLADGRVRSVVVSATVLSADGVRLAVGAALTLAKQTGALT